MYNYYQPYAATPFMQPQSSQGQYQAAPPQLKGRPVSSIEEARAAQIDFDGSIFIFPDTANRKIYTKCINMDGTSTLNTFELVETPPAADSNYITREELNKVIEELKQTLSLDNKSNKPTLNF